MLQLKKNFTQNKILYSIFLALALPYPMTACIYTILSIYVLCFHRECLTQNKKLTTPILWFLLIITSTSLIYQNWLGVFVCIILTSLFILTFYYITYATKEIFNDCLILLLVLSIIWAIISLFQYHQILQNNNIQGFVIKFFSRRENRISAVMMNANYYASTLEIVILIAVYKLFNTVNIKHKFFYFIICCINIAMLMLTASRAGWIAIIGGLFVYFVLNKNKYIASIFILCSIFVLIYFCLNTHLIPRIDYLIDNLSVRFNIFETAIKGIFNKPLFGQGPMTYMMIYEQYGGHNTHHSHNILLEPLLSFGIIGTITLSIFFKNIALNLITHYKKNYKNIALIIAICTTTIIHGMADFSIFFIQPGILFLLLMLSYNIKGTI